jgi:hypothetical protein
MVFIVGAPLIPRLLGSDRDVDEWHDEDLPPP